jgi:predicted HicB family RNase H-like nuclease
MLDVLFLQYMQHNKQGDDTMAKKIKVIQMRNFPADLHKRAKIQAAKEETTLKEIVIRALTEYLERKGG